MKTNGPSALTRSPQIAEAHAQEREAAEDLELMAETSADPLAAAEAPDLAVAPLDDVGVEAEGRVVDEDAAVDIADVDRRASRPWRSRDGLGGTRGSPEVFREVVERCRAGARRAALRRPRAPRDVADRPSPPPRRSRRGGARSPLRPAPRARRRRTSRATCAARAGALRRARRTVPRGAASLPPPEPALRIAATSRFTPRPWPACGARTQHQRNQADRQPGDAFGERRADVAQIVDAQVHAR